MFFLIICFRFLFQFSVFSGGRGVCLAIVGGHWHGLMTISSDGGAVKPDNACFCMCVMPHAYKTLLLETILNQDQIDVYFLQQHIKITMCFCPFKDSGIFIYFVPHRQVKEIMRVKELCILHIIKRDTWSII